MYIPNSQAPKYIKQLLTDLKAKIHSNAIIVEDFNISLSTKYRSFRQKINKTIMDLILQIKQTQHVHTHTRIYIKHSIQQNTGIPHFLILLYCASQTLQFLQPEGLQQPYVKEIYWCYLANSICSFCGHILVILAIFQTFSLLLYLLMLYSLINL